MKKRLLAVTTATFLLLFCPVGSSAQVAWQAPLLAGPGATSGLGFHLTDTDPGTGIGGLLTWRGSAVPGGIGVRVGLAEGFRGDLTGYGGIDVTGRLVGPTEDFPLVMSWATGAGAAVGDYAMIGFPLGLFVGRTFSEEDVRFSPYAGAVLALEGHIGRESQTGQEQDELDLGIVVDLGTDIAFTSEFAIRFGGTVGDRNALSIGIVLPGVR